MSKHHCLTQTLLSILLLSGAATITTSCSSNSNASDIRNLAEKQKQIEVDSLNKITDAQFLVTAAEFSLRQIKLGQLAQLKGTMKEIKPLGKMMETDHIKSLHDLMSLAGHKGISVPNTVSNDVEDVFNILNRKTGNDFDKEYCNRVVTRHKEVIDLFEKASVDATDADIKAWATISLPLLHSHLEHAMACQNKLDKMESLITKPKQKN